MAYDIAVPDGESQGAFDSDASFLYSEYFGSAANISLYWSSVGEKLNLPLFRSLGDVAASEEGFRISGKNLDKLENELVLIEEFWETDDFIKEAQLLDNLKNQSAKMRKAIQVAKSNSSEVIIY